MRMTIFPTTRRTCPWVGTVNPFLTGYTNFTVSIFLTTAKFVETSLTKDLKHFRDTLLSGGMHTVIFSQKAPFKVVSHFQNNLFRYNKLIAVQLSFEYWTPRI